MSSNESQIGITDIDEIMTVCNDRPPSVFKKIILTFLITLVTAVFFSTDMTNLDAYVKVLCATVIPTVLLSVYFFFEEN